MLPFWIDGRFYPAGSYVVDMHQPKRGLANAMLEAGRDLSDAGAADVRHLRLEPPPAVGRDASTSCADGTLPAITVPVSVARPTGGLPRAVGRDLVLTVISRATTCARSNALLEQGVPVALDVPTARSSCRPRTGRAAATVADRYGVRFTLGAVGAAARRCAARCVAAAAGRRRAVHAARAGLRRAHRCRPAVLNAGFDLTGVDVLYVSAGPVVHGAERGRPQARVDAFLATGGVVTRGATGARFNADGRAAAGDRRSPAAVTPTAWCR